MSYKKLTKKTSPNLFGVCFFLRPTRQFQKAPLTAKVSTAKRKYLKKAQNILNPSMTMTAPNFFATTFGATFIYADFG
jgi:hypothetical protein